MKEILNALHQKPVAYYPIYAKITGSITGGVALSQLMYWFSTAKNSKTKIYKTDAELQEETHLSNNEMRAVKKKLKALPFITVSREGVPARTFYKIDWGAYESSLVKFTKLECDDGSLVETNSTDCGNSPSKISEIHETITESTQRLTENTSLVATKVDDDTPKAFAETILEAIEVAQHLSTKLSESIDNFKSPSGAGLHQWAKDIDRAIRLDNRTKSQMIEAIDWIHDGAGHFWIPNIMSGKKLRDQFDKVAFQMGDSKPKINIRDRARADFGVGKPFFQFKDTETGDQVKVCIFGDYDALYDYDRNKYVDKATAARAWKFIEKNYDVIAAHNINIKHSRLV